MLLLRAQRMRVPDGSSRTPLIVFIPETLDPVVVRKGSSNASIQAPKHKFPASRPVVTMQNGMPKPKDPPLSECAGEDSPSSNVTAPPDMWFVEYLTPHDAYHHGVRELLHASKSAYQTITIADTGAYGRALFLDGKIQTAEGDEPFYHEPLVHVPCAHCQSPANVLILGGADGGAAREALRWKSVQNVVVVDIDRDVVDACKKYLPSIADGSLDDERCELVICDALDYVDDCQMQFDVVICDLTDPMEDSPSLSLFTVEFFQKLKKCMRDDGALSIQVGPASLVESSRLMPRVCATLRSVFKTVDPYQVFVPTYGSPLGMAVARKGTAELPDDTKVDQLFAKQINSELTVLDGPAFSALFALPRSTRKAIQMEQEIFTEHNTANAFGRGTLNNN